MGFAVFHTEKGKGSGGGLGNHIDRTKGKEHSYPHADPERGIYNAHFIKTDVPLPEAVNNRIQRGYTSNKPIRKDAVKFLSHVLTGSHEEMVEIFKNPKQADEWIQDNLKFCEDEFGKENIVRFSLHLDEKTPHIHCVTVPLTADGRLSAKEIMGNRVNLSERQDRYAAAMEKYNLERGIKNTGIKHDTAKEYYGRVKAIDEEASNLVVKGLFGVDKDKTLQNFKKAFKSAEIEARMNEVKIKQLKGRNSSLDDENDKLEKDIVELRKKNNETYRKIEKMATDPTFFTMVQRVLEEQKKKEKPQAKQEQNNQKNNTGGLKR